MALEERPLSPSGHQIDLVWNDQHAAVTAVGAGLRAYSMGGRELLDGYRADEMSPGGRNAFRTGEGVIHLAPGESFTCRWGIAASGPEAGA